MHFFLGVLSVKVAKLTSENRGGKKLAIRYGEKMVFISVLIVPETMLSSCLSVSVLPPLVALLQALKQCFKYI